MMLSKTLIDHLVDLISVKSPLPSDLDPRQPPLLSAPIDRHFLHFEVSGNLLNRHDLRHGKPPYRYNAECLVQ